MCEKESWGILWWVSLGMDKTGMLIVGWTKVGPHMHCPGVTSPLLPYMYGHTCIIIISRTKAYLRYIGWVVHDSANHNMFSEKSSTILMTVLSQPLILFICLNSAAVRLCQTVSSVICHLSSASFVLFYCLTICFLMRCVIGLTINEDYTVCIPFYP